MKTYFLSSQPCALTLNGAYFGITDKFGRFAELSLKDNVLAQFTPQDALPLSCFLSEQLRFTPPKGFEVYLLKDAIVLYARDFPPADFTLQVLTQKRFDAYLVTLFRQGALQLSIEWENNLFTSTLPPSFANSTLSYHGGLFFLNAGSALAAYTKNAECVLREETLRFSFEGNELTATLPLFDSLQCVAECAWTLSEMGCERKKCTLLTKERENIPALLPYVFFESLLLGGNYAEYLSDELLTKQDALRDFIGDFQSVIFTDEPNVCALFRKRKENLYEAAYFAVEVKDGKIVDIKN